MKLSTHFVSQEDLDAITGDATTTPPTPPDLALKADLVDYFWLKERAVPAYPQIIRALFESSYSAEFDDAMIASLRKYPAIHNHVNEFQLASDLPPYGPPFVDTTVLQDHLDAVVDRKNELQRKGGSWKERRACAVAIQIMNYRNEELHASGDPCLQPTDFPEIEPKLLPRDPASQNGMGQGIKNLFGRAWRGLTTHKPKPSVSLTAPRGHHTTAIKHKTIKNFAESPVWALVAGIAGVGAAAHFGVLSPLSAAFVAEVAAFATIAGGTVRFAQTRDPYWFVVAGLGFATGVPIDFGIAQKQPFVFGTTFSALPIGQDHFDRFLKAHGYPFTSGATYEPLRVTDVTDVNARISIRMNTIRLFEFSDSQLHVPIMEATNPAIQVRTPPSQALCVLETNDLSMRVVNAGARISQSFWVKKIAPEQSKYDLDPTAGACDHLSMLEPTRRMSGEGSARFGKTTRVSPTLDLA
jgi:hypothetical protein